MKNTIYILFLFIFSATYAQVAMGKGSLTNETSVSLEFGTDNKGIILPWVISSDKVANAVAGTLIYDTSVHKVMYKNNDAWVDISVDTTGTADTSLQDSLGEEENAKVAIGKDSQTDTTPGVLVLTDTDRAMILPLVDSPHEKIINPAPGMVVYDTTAKQLAVFNGTVWSFWKPAS